MFNVVVVVLFLIALGLLWKTREHLAPTQHILAPLGDIETGYQTYTTEQQDKIWRSLSEGSRNFMIAPYMPRSDDDARYTSDDIYKYAKRDASWIIANFYKDVYAPAKSPITASDVDAWLKKNAMESYPQYRAMLESY
jgi:hypothetical protein